MFCSKCGKSNPDGARFCKYCGNRFEIIKTASNTPMPARQPDTLPVPAVSTSVPAVKTSVSKLNIFIAAQVIIIVLLIYAGKMVAGRYYSPAYIASQYFECLMNGHPEKAYSYCTENDGSGFVTKDMYCSVIGSGNKKLLNYKIKEIDKNFSSYIYKITYRLADDKKNYTTKIIMERDKNNKKFFLLDNWKVNMSGFTSNDYIVYAPEDSQVKLDGILLTEKNAEKGYDEEVGSEYYKIGNIFHGEHFIEVHSSYFQDIKDSFNISDDEAEQYYFPDIYMKEDILEKIAADTNNKFNAIMQAAGDSDYSSVIDKCVTEENQYSSSTSLEEVLASTYTYDKLLVRDISIEASDYGSEDGLESNCIATATVKADVYYIYTDNFYGRDYYNDEADIYMTAYFFYGIGDDGKLQINNISFYA